MLTGNILKVHQICIIVMLIISQINLSKHFLERKDDVFMGILLAY